jgi:hypothetical protein
MPDRASAAPPVAHRLVACRDSAGRRKKGAEPKPGRLEPGCQGGKVRLPGPLLPTRSLRAASPARLNSLHRGPRRHWDTPEAAQPDPAPPQARPCCRRLRTSAAHARWEQIDLGDVAPVIELTKELIGCILDKGPPPASRPLQSIGDDQGVRGEYQISAPHPWPCPCLVPGDCVQR